nr:alpha/beta hydrolase fold family protein [uncultured bacterium]
MHADSRVGCRPETTSVPCDGTDVALRILPGADGAPVITVWPGLGAPAAFYHAFACRLHEAGFAVVTVDLPGQGASRPVAGPGFGYHELAARVWPAVIGEVRRVFPGRPVYLLGHSLGGQVSLLYAARDPEVSGIVLVASGSLYFRRFPPPAALRLLVGSQLVAVITAVWGRWPGDRLRFGGRQPAVLMRDWARFARTGRLAPHGADVDYHRRLAELRVPVLAVSVGGDTYAPPSAVDHLCGFLPCAPVTRWHLDGDLDHLRWVRRGDLVAARIRRWADTHG